MSHCVCARSHALPAWMCHVDPVIHILSLCRRLQPLVMASTASSGDNFAQAVAKKTTDVTTGGGGGGGGGFDILSAVLGLSLWAAFVGEHDWSVWQHLKAYHCTLLPPRQVSSHHCDCQRVCSVCQCRGSSEKR